jgi:hypothetical protein
VKKKLQIMQVIRPKWSWNLLNYQLNLTYKKPT